MDDGTQCIVRRVISAEGRSRAFINGNPVSMQQLKDFGDHLLDIHGQHFHQSLGKRAVQRSLLDHFGGLLEDCARVAAAFTNLKGLEDRLQLLRAQASDRSSRLELVAFQLDEMDKLAAEDGEFALLDAERRKLMHSGRLAEGIARSMQALSDGDTSAGSAIANARREIEQLVDYDASLAAALELLNSAEIQVSEAYDTIVRSSDDIDDDPGRQQWVEQRLDALQSVARKHRIEPDQLNDRHAALRQEHDELLHADEIDQELEVTVARAKSDYDKLASKLSKRRQGAAAEFAAAVTDAMSGLGMPGGRFDVSIGGLDQPQTHGQDRVEFLISANPGQSPMPLSKVASGGELARMSLAIQVIASDGSAIPTMIFDEVDSGVGGGVAEIVGRRLAELGGKRQVLCVTHLPQVASLADHHLRVSKVSDGNATRTGIVELGEQERIEELARMLGGVDITQKTLEHAAEMLSAASRKRA